MWTTQPQQKIKLRTIIFIVALNLLPAYGFAKVYTATQSGNWNDPATWGGTGIPTATDDVNNTQGATVTLTADAACKNLTLGSWGSEVIALGSYSLSVNGNLIFNCSMGTITTSSGYLILNGTTQTITLCANMSIPNLRLENSTSVSVGLRNNLTITGNFDCRTGSSTFTNATAAYNTGTLRFTGTCSAPNCTFTVANNNINSAIDFASSTSNPVQVGSVINNQSNSTITFGSKAVNTTTPFSGTNTTNIIASGTVTTGYPKQFRSVQSGNWNATSTWQQSQDGGFTWVAATSTPTYANDIITIQSAHIVTVTTSVTLDQVIVNAGGQIAVNSGVTLTIADGAGTDMSVDGTIVNSGGSITTTGTLAFNSGSIYNHAMDGGAIPAGVWDPNSTCLVTGILTTVPAVSSFAQNFGNFTWNCPSQTGNLSLIGNLTTVNGDFNMVDTHTGSLRLADGRVTANISLAGNFLQTGGAFYLCGTINPCTITLEVSGNFTLSGGTFNMSGNGGVGTLTVAKDFIQSGGTITESGSGSGSIIFNGTNMQTYTSGGTVSNTINFTVNSGAYLQMAASNTTVSGKGSFTLFSGATLGVTSPNGIVTGTTASGNILVTGIRTYSTGAKYIYNGSVAQATGNGLAQNVPADLTINNSAGVTLSAATTLSGALILTNGVLTTTSAKLLTISNNSASAIAGGGVGAFVDGPLAWGLPATTTGSTYNFPVGSGTTYLPFAISSPTTAAIATVQAFVAASGLTTNVDGTLSAKSNTEYWQLTAGTSTDFAASSVSVGKGTTPIYPYDVIAVNSNKTGTYTSVNGTTGAFGVAGSDKIGAGASRYFVLATSKIAKLNVSTTALSSFNYIYDFGPSALQSFTVSGNLLTSDMTITPPADYEISIDGGTPFSLTPLTAPKTGVTTVYVRLKAGLAVGTYNAETITITTATSGVSAKTITCSGFVSATAPSIVAGGGIDCSTNSINLTSTYSSGVNNLYWTGPNSFYSTTQNPSIANATSVNEGTYIVTGNVLSGVNLITNGNFESGATGFTSGYSYKAPNGGGTLWNAATYTVAANPNSVHSNFSSCSDHTTGGTTPVGQQMIINGASAANISIWGQNVPVTPNTIYQFTYWVQSVTGTNPSQLQLYVNNASAGPTYTADASTCSWKKFVYNWNSGSATTANLSLVNQNTNGDGNDFALDDIDFEAVLQISSSVKVTLDKAPSLLIVTAAANPVAAGTNVTFSTIPTNGGTAPTFQWYVNGSLVPGATSPTYSYVPSDGDAVTCVMTPVGACVSAPVTSDPIVIMTVTSTPNYWIGTSSTNWSVPANWSNGVVPKSGDDVIFATAANNKGKAAQSDLYADANHTIGNLINASDKKLVIQPTQVVVVNQKITTSSADQIYIQSSPTQANGSLIFYNDHTTSPVLGTVEMYSKANYNAAGVAFNGNTYNYTWQYFGIPIESITAEPTFYGSWVRKWDETGADMTTHWVQLGNADKVNPFYGYEITQQVATGKTIVFQGQLVNRNFTTPLLASTSTALFPGQHILANPYTAAIDIKKFLATNVGADFDGSVYLYSTGSYADWGNGGGQGSADGTSPGQYQAVNNMAGTGGLPSQIPSMQGFLVQVLTGSQPNSTITFNYNDVVKNSEQQRIKGTEALSAEDMISTKVEVKGANYSDKMWIFTDSTFTKKYDKGWDGTKIYGSALAPQLYAVGTDGIYQINAVNDLNNTTLGFERGVDSTYTFTFTHENVDRRYSGIYLVDSIEHKTINITASGSQYQFTVNKKGVYPNRFKIVTLKNEPTSPETSSKIDLFNFDNMIFVNNVTNEEGQFSLYDMSGRQISSSRFGPNSLNWVSSIPSQGIYIGKAITNSEKNTKRFIAKFRIRE